MEDHASLAATALVSLRDSPRQQPESATKRRKLMNSEDEEEGKETIEACSTSSPVPGSALLPDYMYHCMAPREDRAPCDFRFDRDGLLKKHLRRTRAHTGMLPYNCCVPGCRKSKALPDQFVWHLQNDHQMDTETTVKSIKSIREEYNASPRKICLERKVAELLVAHRLAQRKLDAVQPTPYLPNLIQGVPPSLQPCHPHQEDTISNGDSPLPPLPPVAYFPQIHPQHGWPYAPLLPYFPIFMVLNFPHTSASSPFRNDKFRSLRIDAGLQRPASLVFTSHNDVITVSF